MLAMPSFVEMWKHADSPFQQHVRLAQRIHPKRLDRLTRPAMRIYLRIRQERDSLRARYGYGDSPVHDPIRLKPESFFA